MAVPIVSERRSLGPHTTVLFGSEQGKYPDGNTVLVRGRDSSLVIDPSLSARSEALDVDRVLLTHTHEDHAAGVSGVRWQELSVHEADLAALRSVDDLMRLYGLAPESWPAMTQMVQERFFFEGWPQATGLCDDDVIDLGGVTVRLIHAPGHTGGHSVYLIEPDGVLVTGDIDLTGFGPYYGDAASSLDAFESTLAMVREIAAAHYVTFHHKGVVEGHEAFAAAVDSYTASIGRRTNDLLALLADGPSTFDELHAHGIVYRAGTRPANFGDSVEAHTIERHLARLLADGAVASDGQQYWLA
ncbi:MAG TPA: MBL fold metallo-hydrolase [Acidimicrobiaceae bacterium]|nr:MBL fold metallo-hydrolase [Acidimicrobiaceae bacterium]